MLHACGWLEGGLVVTSLEKFIIDADHLGTLSYDKLRASMLR